MVTGHFTEDPGPYSVVKENGIGRRARCEIGSLSCSVRNGGQFSFSSRGVE